MKTLTITGASGAGKTTCLNAYRAERQKAVKQRSLSYIVEKGKVNAFKQTLHSVLMGGPAIDAVFIDFEGRPTPAFMSWLQINLPNRVKFLVIAHG